MTDVPSLESMTLTEKLQLIEKVWDDVCRQAGDVRSPDWHRAALEERERRLRDGQSTISSWSDAKKRLHSLGQ